MINHISTLPFTFLRPNAKATSATLFMVAAGERGRPTGHRRMLARQRDSVDIFKLPSMTALRSLRKSCLHFCPHMLSCLDFIEHPLLLFNPSLDILIIHVNGRQGLFNWIQGQPCHSCAGRHQLTCRVEGGLLVSRKGSREIVSPTYHSEIDLPTPFTSCSEDGKPHH